NGPAQENVVVPDVLITFTGLIIAALITGTCTVMTSLYAARSARRARVSAQQAPAQGQTKLGMLGWGKHRKKVLAPLALGGLLIGVLVFQVFSIFRASAIRGFNEPSRSQEWMAWRIKVHKILSRETGTVESLQKDEAQRGSVEQALVKALQVHKPPAA